LSRSLDRLAIALAADTLIGNDIDRRWLQRAEDLVAGDEATHRDHANLLAWVRGSALARERRYADAIRVFSTVVDTDGAGVKVRLHTVPPLCHATAAYWERDLERATRLLENSIRQSLDAGVGAMYFPAVLNLFEVLILRGDPHAAANLLQRARVQAEQSGWSHTLGMGWLSFGEAEQAYAANDLDAAGSGYRQAIDLTRFAGSNTLPLLAQMRLATIAHLRGDRSGALLMANEVAATTHRPNASFLAGRFERMLAHMWLMLGNVDEAGRILAAIGLAPDDAISPAREEEYVELARWHIARRRAKVIFPMLAKMLIVAEAGGRTRSIVELQILQAAARQQEGDLRQACVVLESALQTAVPLRDRRMFLNAGRDIAALLRRVGRQDGLPADVQALVDVLLEDPCMLETGRASQSPGAMAEPLSRQELEVLRMLGAGYANAEIGRALFISPNTVKTHLRHVYEKLGVKTRSAAVSRAAALRLLEF
jgi:LuxR family maltose regulon positive regulatory protein